MIRFTGANTPTWDPNVPRGVNVAKGVKGVAYGSHGVVIKGSDFRLIPTPDPLEFVLPEGATIPPEAGFWITAEDYAAARGTPKPSGGGGRLTGRARLTRRPSNCAWSVETDRNQADPALADRCQPQRGGAATSRRSRRGSGG